MRSGPVKPECDRDALRPAAPLRMTILGVVVNVSEPAMKKFFCALLTLLPIAVIAEEATPKFDAKAAARFAELALACVGKEYPNKISHVLNSDADVAPPRKLTPSFCGCYD